MSNQQKVINVVNHYEPGTYLTSNKADLDAALEDGWQFKGVCPNIAANNPYLFSPNLLGISYVMEKIQDTNEEKHP